MTAKEKAEELVHDYYTVIDIDFDDAKQCALIVVEEILKALPEDYQNDIWSYWQDVEKEIEKL